MDFDYSETPADTEKKLKSSRLTRDLCNLITDTNINPETHLSNIISFFDQFKDNETGTSSKKDESLCLRTVLDNSNFGNNTYEATPLLTSYFVCASSSSSSSSSATATRDVFNYILDRLAELWTDDGDYFETHIAKISPPQNGGMLLGEDDKLPVSLTLINYICRVQDEVAFSRVLSTTKSIIGAENLSTLLFSFRLAKPSPILVCLKYTTPAFFDFVLKTVAELLGQELFDSCIRDYCAEDRFTSYEYLRAVCTCSQHVEMTDKYFRMLLSLGGDALVRRIFDESRKSKSSPPITVSMLGKQKSISIVKYVYMAILSVGGEQFLGEELTAIFAQKYTAVGAMLSYQQSMEIVQFIFKEVIEKYFLGRIDEILAMNSGILDSFELLDPVFRLYFESFFLACGDCKSHDLLRFLLDGAIEANSGLLMDLWSRQNTMIDLVGDPDVSTVALQMIFAHFESAELCTQAARICQKAQKPSRSLDVSRSNLLQQPQAVWGKCILQYRSWFDGELPPVAPWKNDKNTYNSYSWLKTIVDNQGLKMNDEGVVKLIISLSEYGISDAYSLGAFDQDQLFNRILGGMKKDKLFEKVREFASAEHEKQQQQNINNNKMPWSSPQPVSLPFLAELVKTHSITTPPLSNASMKILFDNEINNVELFLQLTADDLKDLSLPLGAQKTIKEIQKKCHLNNAAASSSSELSQRISSEFPPNYIISSKIIELGQQLGSGGFGQVYKGVLTDCNRPVAVKLFRDVITEQAINECKIAMNLHHKNIISLVGVSIFTFNAPTTREEIAAVLELGRGTLQQKLSSLPLLPWDRVFKYSFEIASGLDYLHNHAKPTMNHLDLKPANVLLDENNIVKLCDFGLSRAMTPDASHVEVSRANFGTLRWMSPEQTISRRMAPTNDVYSFGCILYNMIEVNGCPPWNTLDESAIYRKLIAAENMKSRDSSTESFLADSLEHRHDCPQFLIDLCKNCLQIDYKDRPKDGGVLVELLRNGIQELVSPSSDNNNNEEWKQTVGDVSYLDSGSSSSSSVHHSVATTGTTSNSQDYVAPSRTQCENVMDYSF